MPEGDLPHVWVSFRYTILSNISINADGSVSYNITEASEEAAKEGAILGCWVCDLPLNKDTIGTTCRPAN